MASTLFSSAASATVPNPPPPLSGVTIQDPNFVNLLPGTALVRYQSLEELMRTRPSSTLRFQLTGLWMVIAIGLYFLFRLSGYQQAIKDIESSQTHSLGTLTAALGNQQAVIDKTNASLKNTTELLILLSNGSVKRQKEVDNELKTEDHVTRQLESRVEQLEAERGSSSSSSGPALSRSKPTVKQDLAVTVPNSIDPTTPFHQPFPSRPHQHNVNLTLPIVNGALLHTNSKDEPDYWLVPKELHAGASVMVRVLPFALQTIGGKARITVHSIDDDRDYNLATDGDWLSK